MMPDTPPSSSRAVPLRKGVLDGEVLPPGIRVVNPEPKAGSTPTRSDTSFQHRLGMALVAGALVATLSGAGALEAYRWHMHSAHATGPSPTAMALAKLSKDMGDLKVSVATPRQDDAAKALKKSVDQLRTELDGLKSANAASVAQMTAKLDARSTAPQANAMSADVVARLDKLDHDPRLADIASRLDRIEHQVSSPTPTGSIAAPIKANAGQSVVTQASAAVPSRAVKAAVLDSWIVRDVYSGIALVEGRSGSVREVVPGEVLPGAGEVRAIERHGRNWIVVTSRGIINTDTW